jgi:hypothetical protein
MHVSDLHRDLADEVDNTYLLESIARDIEQYGNGGSKTLIRCSRIVTAFSHAAESPASRAGRKLNQKATVVVPTMRVDGSIHLFPNKYSGHPYTMTIRRITSRKKSRDQTVSVSGSFTKGSTSFLAWLTSSLSIIVSAIADSFSAVRRCCFFK